MEGARGLKRDDLRPGVLNGRTAEAEVVLDVARYDPVSQLLEENHVRLTPTGVAISTTPVSLLEPGLSTTTPRGRTPRSATH